MQNEFWLNITALIGIMATLLTMFGICFKHIANKDIHLSPTEEFVTKESCNNQHKALVQILDTKLGSLKNDIEAHKELMRTLIKMMEKN